MRPGRGHPQSQKEKPWRKSSTFPSLPALGVGFPTPRLLASSSAFVGCESQPTSNGRPPTPLVEGHTDAHFSLQSTPRARHNRFQDAGTGPATLGGGLARWLAALRMQMSRGGSGGRPRVVPPSLPSGWGADPAASCYGACSFVLPFEESKQTRL